MLSCIYYWVSLCEGHVRTRSPPTNMCVEAPLAELANLYVLINPRSESM